MNRTIKEASVKRCHYETHEQLRKHRGEFIVAFNFGRRLKTPQSADFGIIARTNPG